MATLMVIYVRLGRLDEARAAAAEWLKTGLSFDPDGILPADPRADEAEVSRRPAQGRSAGAR